MEGAAVWFSINSNNNQKIGNHCLSLRSTEPLTVFVSVNIWPPNVISLEQCIFRQAWHLSFEMFFWEERKDERNRRGESKGRKMRSQNIFFLT